MDISLIKGGGDTLWQMPFQISIFFYTTQILKVWCRQGNKEMKTYIRVYRIHVYTPSPVEKGSLGKPVTIDWTIRQFCFVLWILTEQCTNIELEEIECKNEILFSIIGWIILIYFHFSGGICVRESLHIKYLAFPHSTLFCFWDIYRINICDVDVPPLILWMVVLTQRSWPRKNLLPNCQRNRKYNICKVDVPNYLGGGRAYGNETNVMQN